MKTPKLSLPLGLHLRKDVVSKRLTVFETCGGSAKSLRRTPSRSDLGHFLLHAISMFAVLTRPAFGLFLFLLFLRSQDHDHLPTFELRLGFHRTELLQICLDSRHQIHAYLRMNHFSATKSQRYFRLVSIF